MSCQLRDLPPDDTEWSSRAADWLMNRMNFVIKVLNQSPLVVDALTEDGSESLVDQMASITHLWDRLTVHYCTMTCMV